MSEINLRSLYETWGLVVSVIIKKAEESGAIRKEEILPVCVQVLNVIARNGRAAMEVGKDPVASLMDDLEWATVWRLPPLGEKPDGVRGVVCERHIPTKQEEKLIQGRLF